MPSLLSPKFLLQFHAWCTVAWIPLTVVAYFIGWLRSVTFVSVISMLALFLGSFSAWQAARTESIQLSQEQTRAAERASDTDMRTGRSLTDDDISAIKNEE